MRQQRQTSIKIREPETTNRWKKERRHFAEKALHRFCPKKPIHRISARRCGKNKALSRAFYIALCIQMPVFFSFVRFLSYSATFYLFLPFDNPMRLIVFDL